MNLRKTLFSAFVVLALSASVSAPVAFAQQAGNSSTTTATVVLGEGGTFNAYFCGPVNMSDPTVTSVEGGTSTGVLEICYEDTKSNRPGFQATVGATDFNGSNGGTIEATNFKLTNVYNTWQGQWGDPTRNALVSVDIGDIGGWAGPTSQQVTAHETPMAYDAPASLDTPRFVAYAWDGVGTASGVLMPPVGTPNDGETTIDDYPAENYTAAAVVDGTYQILDVELDVPSGLPAGTYTSSLTLTIVAESGYPD